MYEMFSPLFQRRTRTVLAAVWFFAGVGGVAVIFSTPLTIIAQLGTALTVGWGVIVGGASFVAFLGVVLGKYRWEWVAAWLASAGITPYVTTLWCIVFFESTPRMAQALFMTALLMTFVLRATTCAAWADRLRQVHAEGGESD